MLNKKKSGAVKTVSLMVVAMCISKVLGMLRGVFMAHAYGISHEATIFSEASRIPLTFFDILLGSAILGCFIPVYNGLKDEKSSDGKMKNDVFASIFLNFVTIVTLVLSFVGIIFAREILSLIAAGLDSKLIDMAVLPLQLMFPLVVFTGMTYTLIGVLQSKDEFLVPAFVSALSNLLVILYFVLFNKYFGIIGLSICYTLSWLVQLLTLIIPLAKKKFKYTFSFNFKNKSFISALKMTPPIMFGAWLTPVSILIGLYFAAFIKIDGAVASFEYANNLFTIIVGILTYGVCNFIFPKLARLSSENGDFVKTASSGLFASFMIVTPVLTAMLVVPEQVVSIVYQRGEFDSIAANNVTNALKYLVPGMLGFTTVELMSRVFYAKKMVYIPMTAALCGISINVVLSYIMTVKMNLGLEALGASFALGLCGAAIVLIVFAIVKLKGIFNLKFLFNMIKMCLAAIISYGVMIIIKNLISPNAFSDGFLINILVGGGIFISGLISFMVSCYFMKILRKGVIE